MTIPLTTISARALPANGASHAGETLLGAASVPWGHGNAGGSQERPTFPERFQPSLPTRIPSDGSRPAGWGMTQGVAHAETVAVLYPDFRNRFRTKGEGPRMGMKPRLATVAKQRGSLALLVFHDALTDPVSPGVIDAREAPFVLDHLTDWQQASELTDAADGFGEAIGRGVGSEDDRRLLALFADYRAKLDEVPLDAA